MALLNRTIFNSLAGGTTDFVVSSPVQGYMTPAQSGAIDSTVYSYSAQTVDSTGHPLQWEIGEGTYFVGSTTLARTSVTANSDNTLVPVSFLSPPQVMISALVVDFVPGQPGPQGFMGMPGLDGSDGDDGYPIPGPQGAQGPQGNTGSIGLTGLSGNPGMDGQDGDDGMSIPGPTGLQGPQGTPGSTGSTGPQGIQGFGTDGLDGDDGQVVPGPQGLQGTQGTPGSTGPQGLTANFIYGAEDGQDGQDFAHGTGFNNRYSLNTDAKNWVFLGTATGATVTVGPVIWTGQYRQFMVNYFISGCNGGTPVGRFLCGAGTPSTTALTNGSTLTDQGPAAAAPTSVSAPSIPGMPLASIVGAAGDLRDGWIFIDGASGSAKRLTCHGSNLGAIATPPKIFHAVSFFSDLGTNLLLQQMQLSVYASLITTAVSANTFLAGTYLTVWGRNND